MVVMTSVYAPSWNYNICVLALTFLYHIHYANSELHRHFLIDGYGIFLALRRTISYLQTMSVYNLCISFSFSYVSMMYPVISPTVSTIYFILPPSVSMFVSDSSLFELTLTTFTAPPTMSTWNQISRPCDTLSP